MTALPFFPADSAYQAYQGDRAYGPTRGERAASAAASLAVCVLLAFVLVRMGAIPMDMPGDGSRLVAVDVSDSHADKPHPKPKARAQPEATRPATAPVIAPPRVVSPLPPVPPLNLIPLTRAEMSAADIGRMTRPAAPAAPASAGSGEAEATAGGAGPGEGRLYPAEWVREPTHAEMATYIPAGANLPGSWATIACRTIDHFHVEDCRELGESPAGSGLARGLRQAAWQFLVRPPRSSGKPLVGTWVSIRFTFTAPPDRNSATGG